MNLWTDLKKLQGKTLFTLGYKRPFEIVEVSNEYVVIKTSKGSERPVAFRKFEKSWEHLEKYGVLTLGEIRSLGYSNFHPTYIAALLANISGVPLQPSQYCYVSVNNLLSP